ncbi:aminotransferase class IV [Kribbella flavida DSM 17836]|uniref:Aminotransferase class IV n=1 Tax=Kribbella flavida (strain DSM 17836 / JCM 10339 / NBRC 14399) TaxID=479435 RepID=D2Q531_KRIFD|nr:aminotransferase class IV [Kribbella flavida]ADB36042.1 aminotransferase class IV [Kribbella flavida DSM 17836]
MTDYLELNGVPLDPVPPALLRAMGYGHFSSLQVRGRRVHGLPFHVERLDRSSAELFGHGLPGERSLPLVKSAVERSGRRDASVRITVFSRRTPEVLAGTRVEPDVLITVGAPIEPTAGARRLQSVEHERTLPQLKHNGTFDLLHLARRARLAGYDDALFTDRAGYVSEASIWNICFVRGDQLVWPAAAALPGITRRVIDEGLARLGVPAETRPVPLADVTAYDAAFLTNSIDTALPVASIDAHRYEPKPEARNLLIAAYEQLGADPLWGNPP